MILSYILLNVINITKNTSYPMQSNWSSFADLFVYADNATGFYGYSIIIASFIVTFASLREYGLDKALGVASFVGMILTFFLGLVLPNVNSYIGVLFIFMFLASIFTNR